MAHFRPQFEILAHFRRLIYRRVVHVYTGTSHVTTSLIPRLSHTIQYVTGSWGEPGNEAGGSLGMRLGGAWERGWGEPGDEAGESLGMRLGGGDEAGGWG